VRDWIERHPSLRWYVPIVVTASLMLELWQTLR
jgi:hypothetical protein